MEVRPGVESELQHGLCHSHHWAKPGIEPHPYRGNGSLTQWAAMGTLDHRFKCKYKTIKHLGEKEEIYHITKIHKMIVGMISLMFLNLYEISSITSFIRTSNSIT